MRVCACVCVGVCVRVCTCVCKNVIVFVVGGKLYRVTFKV